MKFTSYGKTISFLYKQLPMFQRVGPKAMKMDLGNIEALMNALGNPQSSLRYVHIAGTNGKGSTAHFVASILQEYGLSVGLYTSPHYKDFRERVKINGFLIAKKDVVSFVNELVIKGIFKTIKPSFFEISVALAFYYFKKKNVDMVVLEVGLGGRLDSTNIITPLISIITNIGLDHQNTLGDTLAEIAVEKAGIIKSEIPVLIGEKQKETTPIFERIAKSKNAPIEYASVIEDAIIKKIELSNFHLNNTRTAIGAIRLLVKYYDFDINDQQIINGINNAPSNSAYFGRYQTLMNNPKVIADGAHNLPGVAMLFSCLALESYQQLHIVLGMVGDKPLDKVLALFPKEAIYYFCKANIPRGKEASLLQKEAGWIGLEGKTYTSVRKALASAKQSAHESDLIIVTGSIYTVAEVI